MAAQLGPDGWLRDTETGEIVGRRLPHVATWSFGHSGYSCSPSVRVHNSWGDPSLPGYYYVPAADLVASDQVDAMTAAYAQLQQREQDMVQRWNQRRREWENYSPATGVSRRGVPALPNQPKMRQADPPEKKPAIDLVDQDWLNELVWSSKATDGAVWAYQVQFMEDEHLWNVVQECIRHAVMHCIRAEKLTAPSIEQSAQWMTSRPLFLALVAQSNKRNLRFPQEITAFLLTYLPDKAKDLPQVKPWEPLYDDHKTNAAIQKKLETAVEQIRIEQLAKQVNKPVRALELD